MTRINAPKGTIDLLPEVTSKWQAVERIARETAELYHFAEIRTPIFEHSELFHRGVGETTDIVGKETYNFTDRDNRSLSLRPEGTAGVVRAVIENGLLNDQGARVKVFYIGPNFRYERPQKGRYRQHHQFGVEAFGVAEPEQDVECILLQMDFYRRCGLNKIGLRINSLGDRQSKANYSAALREFLSPQASRLSDESQRRLVANPLRILDSKDPRDQWVYVEAPPMINYLSDESFSELRRAMQLLEAAGIPKWADFLRDESDRKPSPWAKYGSPTRDLSAYVAADLDQALIPAMAFGLDPKLVRGFDYYTGIVWEITTGGLGSQSALGGGGRYDNLVETLGGRPTPGVGFGSGLERLLIALAAQGVNIETRGKPLVWLVSLGDAARDANLKLLAELRAADIAADMDPTGRSPKAQFKQADREKAEVAIVVGDTELANNTVAVKNLATTEQQTVPRAELLPTLRRMLSP